MLRLSQLSNKCIANTTMLIRPVEKLKQREKLKNTYE